MSSDGATWKLASSVWISMLRVLVSRFAPDYPSYCASINETETAGHVPKSLLAAALLSLINAIKTSLPIHTLLNYDDYYYYC